MLFSFWRNGKRKYGLVSLVLPTMTLRGPCGERRPPTKAEIEDAALWVGFEESSRRLKALIETKAKLGPDSFVQMQHEFEQRYLDVCRRQFAGEDDYWRDRAVKMIARRQWDLPEGSPDFAFLIEQLSRCGIDLFRKAVETLRNPILDFQPTEHTRNLSRKRQERAKAGEGIITFSMLMLLRGALRAKKGMIRFGRTA